MKVSFNQTTQINNCIPVVKSLRKEEPTVATVSAECSAVPSAYYANFCNVTFGSKKIDKTDIEFLLSFADKFKCAYTGLPMISKSKAKAIYEKLEKRTTAQSAINLLQYFKGYMHDIESIVFDILCEASHKNKRDFQDILLELAPESLERIKLQQFKILNSINHRLPLLSEPVREQVIAARDSTLTKMENGTFVRKEPLEKIKAINAKGQDLKQIIKIYRKWYKLPASSNNLDAFIVSYSKKPHQQIAKRLISSAVASIEHVKPQSRRGSSDLSNLILVSAQFNNARSSMPLWEFIMLNPQIDFAVNLQNYMDNVIMEVHDKNSLFAKRAYYPEKIKEAIDKETNSSIILDTDKLCLTRNQRNEIKCLKKLGDMYKIIEK